MSEQRLTRTNTRPLSAAAEDAHGTRAPDAHRPRAPRSPLHEWSRTRGSREIPRLRGASRGRSAERGLLRGSPPPPPRSPRASTLGPPPPITGRIPGGCPEISGSRPEPEAAVAAGPKKIKKSAASAGGRGERVPEAGDRTAPRHGLHRLLEVLAPEHQSVQSR